MGVCNSNDIFQEKISELFQRLSMLCLYIYDVLVITKHYFKDHIKYLEIFLQRLAEKGLQVNTEQSYFEQTETELPVKEVESIPWSRLLVDLIGPYKIRREGHDNPLILKLQ